jgi:hypothetical protein
VQTAAAANYDDLPANAAFTVLLFSICDLWSNPEKFRRPAPWAVMFLAAFAAANTKLQTSLFVCLTLPFLVPPVWRLLRGRKTGWPAIVGTALLGFGASLLITINLIKNLLLYRNPLFPVDLNIAGIHFAGTLVMGDWLTPGRAYENLPERITWILSILEYRSLDGRSIPYMNGMGNVPITGPSAYMGGFFSALVVASICFLFVCADRRRDRLSFIVLLIFIAASIIIPQFPNSHILRYEMFWMMFLVIGCLLLLRNPSLEPYQQSYKFILSASLVFVTSVTGGVYFTPVWNPMQEYVDRSGAEQLLEKVVQPGDIICLEQGQGKWDNRFAIIFSPIFHQKLSRERPYGIKEGFCDGYKTIPPVWRR